LQNIQELMGRSDKQRSQIYLLSSQCIFFFADIGPLAVGTCIRHPFPHNFSLVTFAIMLFVGHANIQQQPL
jgi:hypothetical protein